MCDFSELEMALCIICKDLCIKDFMQVGSKERATLVAASLERPSGLHELVKIQQPLTLQIACRKAYNLKSPTRSEKRKSKESAADEEFEPPTLRSRTSLFDINTLCLFCSEVLLNSSRLYTKRKRITSHLETKEFKNNILKRATEKGG
ncbi:MAG: hypothetical protein GY705_08325 [Bacteroidetes bacterium]|nr:hypothetical protein [Bacteroidota bacterium]